jgi:F-type H+-transporting ATPase subunit gamma
MSGLKEIRTRIASIRTTRQVTSAMKMVSAAKLKKAQDAIIHFRPYANKLHEILNHLADTMDCYNLSPYCTIRPVQRVLIVVIASERGLCGGFNLNVSRLAEELLLNEYANLFEKNHVDIISIGKQGERQLKVAGIPVTQTRHDVWSNFGYPVIEDIATEILEKFASGYYDRVELIYNEFVNAAMQMPVNVEFLPVHVEGEKVINEEDFTIYEPSKAEIAQQLIPRMLKIELFRAVLESQASEQGARMTAMHMATDNATQLINELSLQYNKTRQAAITKEILEITAGAEALSH